MTKILDTFANFAEEPKAEYLYVRHDCHIKELPFPQTNWRRIVYCEVRAACIYKVKKGKSVPLQARGAQRVPGS